MLKTKLLALLSFSIILGCLSIFGFCAAILPDAKSVKQTTGIVTAQTTENKLGEGFQVGHSIRFEFVAENVIGDIPIVSDFSQTEVGLSNSREKFSRNLSRNFNEKNLILKDDRFTNSPSAKFTDTANKGFSGIGTGEFARAKV